MKTITQYIFEKDSNKKNDDKSLKLRSGIKFTIWKQPDQKVSWLKDNEKYQKIEYKHEDKKEHLSIDFLLGFIEDSWHLWIGKPGSCSYDDDPYFNFKTNKFSEAVIGAIDKIEEFINKVKDDKENYVQFYTNL